MSKINKIALTSLVGMSLLSSVAFAAPQAMQNAANNETKMITNGVNNGATESCPVATMRIASAAKGANTNLKGAELRVAIIDATSTAAKAYKIQGPSCVSDVLVSDAASKLTGMQAAGGPAMGMAKAGGAAGGLAAAGLGGVGVGTVVGGLLLGGAVLAAVNDDDDASN